MAPHIDGDRPKASRILVPVRPQAAQSRKCVRFTGMAGGARVSDSGGRTGSLPRPGFGETYAVPVSSPKKTWRHSGGDILDDISDDSLENVYAKLCPSNTTKDNNSKVLGRKESVRTVIVNNMKDMGEIERILNDSSSDGYITSECERNLREKYGLHFEHSFMSYERQKKEVSFSSSAVTVDESFSYMNETVYGAGYSCGGGALMRQKFNDIVKRYSDFVHATAFARRVVSRAKNPSAKKRTRCLKASKIHSDAAAVETVIKPAPTLTVIPELSERTVGEALMQKINRHEEANVSPEIALDLGNGDFERRRQASEMNGGVVMREKKSQVSHDNRGSTRESVALGWSNVETRNNKKFRCSKLLSNDQKRVSGISNRNSNGANYRNSCASNRNSNSHRNSYVGDRSSMMEEGASTSWLLVLYSPEFAPKTAKEKR